ncbi:MAG: M23 family metallopeptidase [Tenericutes bacterium]|nr:M23 family metallopeptidase [Mycoplasmatota bacterium]
MIKLMYPTRFIGIAAYFHDPAYKKKFGTEHNGIDLYRDEKKDIPIYSAGKGKVYAIKDNDHTGKSWGNYVKIDHGNNVYTLYGHLQDGIKVKVGQEVDTNTVLGIMGTSGNSTGIHTHYEVYLGGASTKYRVNPIDYTYANHTDYRFSIYPEKYKGVKFIEDTTLGSDDKDKQIQELQDELKKTKALNVSYQAEIKELEEEIKELTEEVEEIDTHKFKYTIKESGIYKKTLQVGDVLIIK